MSGFLGRFFSKARQLAVLSTQIPTASAEASVLTTVAPGAHSSKATRALFSSALGAVALSTLVYAEASDKTYSGSEVKALVDGGHVVVSIGSDLYDVTDFLETHPGGTAVLKAANGHDILSVWRYSKDIESKHIGNPTVTGYLEKYRIGRLDKPLPAGDPMKIFTRETAVPKNIFGFHDAAGMNVETYYPDYDPESGEFEVFFVRDHAPEQPKTKGITFKAGSTFHQVSLDQFKIRAETESLKHAPIICAGASRSAFGAGVSGTQWGSIGGDAIGALNVKAIPMLDVIAELAPELLMALKSGSEYFSVEGTDGYFTVIHKSELENAYIGVDTASAELSDLHGGSLRLLMPGYPGFRNIKKVESITALPPKSDAEIKAQLREELGNDLSFLTAVQRGLLAHCPKMRPYLLRDKSGEITGFRERFSVSSKLFDVRVEDGFVKAEGVAYAAAGIREVRLFAESGESTLAKTKTPKGGDGQMVFFEAAINDEKSKFVTAVATDNNGDTQTVSLESLWNQRGLYATSALQPTPVPGR